MMPLKTLYKMPQAVDYLASFNHRLDEDDLFTLAETEKLPICFKFEGDISPVDVEHNGKIEQITHPCPFNGVLRCLTPPRDNTKTGVSIVEVVSVTSQIFKYDSNPEDSTNPLLVEGYRFPTTEPHGGEIQKGYRVTGWLSFGELPASDWLFHIDDLRALSETVENVDQPAPEEAHAPEQVVPALTVATSTQPLRGITKQQVMNAFEGLHFDRTHWGRNLATPPDWLVDCRVAKGNKKTSALWNPALIASGLFDKQVPLNKLDAVFVSLKYWVDEWVKVSDGFRQ